MKRIPSWLTYTVLRLLVFAVPLAILLLVGLVWWLAVIAAALIGLCLSYIFLSRPRNAVSSDLYAARHRETPAPSEDADAEDAAIDNAAIDNAATDAAATPSESESRAQRDSH
ncbi:DUF4229 domain-containing protein [Leifsonia sp. F6_8S_P_1B]|uniref:DUF4229 domain-containing protein n=1 Tax=Leifsonia williamsii TaxID=3035919 RepID=A0ABT8K9L5_9MICO|nr:DUF4229 domain-containing protein [Leifsonia williamsii]MDN4613678.1 DUF4229 domain-containing protein [Leifsonia williamsii]